MIENRTIDEKFWLEGEPMFSYSAFNIIPVYLQFHDRAEPRFLLEGYRKIRDSLPGLDRKWTLLYLHEDFERTVFYYNLKDIAIDIVYTGEERSSIDVSNDPQSAHAKHLIEDKKALPREHSIDLEQLTQEIERLRIIKTNL